MKKAAVLLDSSSTFDGKNKENIFMIPLTIILNDNGIKEYKDLVDTTHEEIYDLINNGKNLSTSQPSIGESINVLESLLKEYETIFVVPISKGISGTYDTFISLAKDIDPKRIIIVDASFLGPPLLNDVARIILEKVRKSESNESIKNFIKNEWHPKVIAHIVVNDISHLKRGGRIGTIASIFANLLKFKIIIKFDGKLDVVGKKTSLKDAVELILENSNKEVNFIKNGIEWISILKNDPYTSKTVDETKKYMVNWLNKNKISFKEEWVSKCDLLPSVISVHTGTDTVCITIKSK